MDILIRNLKTYELKKQQELEKKNEKEEKSLELEASKYDLVNDEEKNVAYFANRIVRAMKESGIF